LAILVIRSATFDYFLPAFAVLAGFADLPVTDAEWAFFAGAIGPALALHFLQKRSLLPSSRKRAPNRAAAPQDVHTYWTFESWTGISLLSTPPCGYFWLRRMCFFDAIHAFDNGLAGGAIHFEHLALLAAVVAGDYFDCVTRAN